VGERKNLSGLSYDLAELEAFLEGETKRLVTDHVEAGGETRFPQLDLKVEARAGRLLMFPPYWMYQHEGLPPQSGDKYIISTYLLF
jgi:hypothetical protein